MTLEDDWEEGDEEEDDGSAELVESGTFRVDPATAAEKLRDYQLPDAKAFLVPWLRAAVAFGASRVEAGVVDGSLAFSFDGASPDPPVLKDLTAGLLQEDRGEPSRHLAFGALALHRLSPSAISAASLDGRTTVFVRWAEGWGPATEALALLREAYGMSATALLIDGEAVADPVRAAVPLVKWAGKKTRIVIVEGPPAAGSGLLRLYKLGALVESLPFDLGGPFHAHMAHNRFSLSLSQSSVVKDARYRRRIRWLGRLRRDLVGRRPSTRFGRLASGVGVPTALRSALAILRRFRAGEGA
ncbi:MAG: hypothetical protein FD126_2172 [Elusimicrobia bacterium]|nr:MAG: hypothetical protein FD126_2172 [Elusimicrobiota bacterium]